MWEKDFVLHLKPVVLPHGERRAYKIAKTVDRTHGRFLERRNEEGTGKVCRMMFNPVQAAADSGRVKAEPLRDRVGYVLDSRRVLCTIAQKAQRGLLTKYEHRLLRQVGVGITSDCNMIQIVRRNPAHRQTCLNRSFREARPMLYAPEPFFFHGGDQLAIDDQSRGNVRMICIDA